MKNINETSGGTLKFLGFSGEYPFTVDDIISLARDYEVNN